MTLREKIERLIEAEQDRIKRYEEEGKHEAAMKHDYAKHVLLGLLKELT